MTNTKIKPPLKFNETKCSVVDWILENFPEDYEDLIFCDLFQGGGSIFLNKKPSFCEVINDSDPAMSSIYKAIRDESKEFITRLKRTRCTERTFKMAKTKSEKTIDDYVDLAVNEYVLRQISKNGNRETFDAAKESGEKDWKIPSKEFIQISKRIKYTHVLNEHFIDVLKVWDEDDTLLFLNPPDMPDPRLENNKDPLIMSVDDHVNLLFLINNARSKIVLTGNLSSLYNRHLKEWTCVKYPSKKTNTDKKKILCLWKNF